MTGLAGCSGGGNGGGGGEQTTTAEGEQTTTTETGQTTTTDGEQTTTAQGGETLSGADYPAVDEWLTETEVGAAEPNYDGTIVDRRDQDTVSVEVGAGDTGLQFAPAAVAVSSGTTVEWEWTGEGGAHNVKAEPGEQIGESDYEFLSGEPTDEAGNTYEQSFGESGIALYHCEPHLATGMKGAVVVE